jgi:hypothetical protein
MSSGSLRPSRRAALLSAVALLGVFGVASVCSAESPWRRRPVPPPPYRVSIEDVFGATLPTFQQGRQTFVLGEPGARYNIRVSNPTSERVEVVVTVDGRDVVSGELGDYVKQRGYLIEPWDSVLIEGFRRSLDDVAAFRFTDRRESYSARRGTPQHVGVIGAAFFTEKKREARTLRRGEPRALYDDHHYYEERSSRTQGARPAPSPAGEHAQAPQKVDGGYDGTHAQAPQKVDGGYDGTHAGSGRSSARPSTAEAARDSAPRSFPNRREYRDDGESRESKRRGASSRRESVNNIGTEYGEQRDSSVIEVAFERRLPARPAALLSLHYDDYAGLEARGIDLTPLGYAYRYDPPYEPEPFPRTRFAPSP